MGDLNLNPVTFSTSPNFKLSTYDFNNPQNPIIVFNPNAPAPDLNKPENTTSTNPSTDTRNNKAEVEKSLKKVIEIDPKTGKPVLDTDKDGFVSSKELNTFIDSEESLKGKVTAKDIFAAWETAGGKTTKGTEAGEDKNGDKKPDGIDFNGDGEINDKDRAISNENVKEAINGQQSGSSFDWKKFLTYMTQVIQQYAQQTAKR